MATDGVLSTIGFGFRDLVFWVQLFNWLGGARRHDADTVLSDSWCLVDSLAAGRVHESGLVWVGMFFLFANRSTMLHMWVHELGVALVCFVFPASCCYDAYRTSWLQSRLGLLLFLFLYQNRQILFDILLNIMQWLFDMPSSCAFCFLPFFIWECQKLRGPLFIDIYG